MTIINAIKNFGALQGARVFRRRLIQRWVRWREEPAEQAFERLVEIASGDIVLKVREFQGEFALPPSSHLFQRLVRYGSYEPILAALFLDAIAPDEDVIDVGANVGFFSVAAAKSLGKGRVLAIEPVPSAYGRLLENIKRNNVAEKVLPFNGMASNINGESSLHVISGKEEYSSVATISHPAVVNSEASLLPVVARKIDDLVAEYGLRPSVIKIDVEGAEGLVFSGARETLVEFRPVVFSELSDNLLRAMGTSARELVSEYQKIGYSVYDPLDRHAPPGTKPYGDMVCVPKGRPFSGAKNIV